MSGGSPGAPAVADGGQIPLFEVLPAFEEDGALDAEAEPVARAFLDERSTAGEGCRLLGARVRALGRDKRLRRLGVVGAGEGEGTTTVALGLARALSHDRRRVLLLELDVERPTLDDKLGFRPPAVGLRRYLAGTDDLPVLRRVRPSGFWVLSAGSAALPGRPGLASPRFATLLRSADRVFDYVVGDCPPLLEGEARAAVQDHLDGFVLVVRSRRLPREEIRRAAARLQPGRLVGLVLNAQHDVLGRRRARSATSAARPR